MINGIKSKTDKMPIHIFGALACELESVSAPPNKAPEPTPTAVTPRAGARVAPAAVVAHL